jgi:hypothetical protein
MNKFYIGDLVENASPESNREPKAVQNQPKVSTSTPPEAKSSDSGSGSSRTLMVIGGVALLSVVGFFAYKK